MGKGGKAANGISNGVEHSKTVTWEEVRKHNTKDDQWIMINRKAYNITEFAKRHPGGAKILNHYAGEDATDAWTAFHNDKELVSKYLKSIYVGDVIDAPESAVQKDFRELRAIVEKNGWMEPEPVFYVAHFLHLILLEALAVAVLWYFGNGWIPILLSMAIMATAQAQMGWTQHDYGHHSVFRSMKNAHIFHHLTIGYLKGASSHWWNFRHFQHHAKPNRIKKDPDIDIAYLFLIGDNLPVEFGKKKRGSMPYQFQHKYWFFLGPPLLLPIYFHFEILYFCIKRRDWLDLLLCVMFIQKFSYMFVPFLGGWGTVAFYFGVRFLESHWFTWVTQMSHLPHDVSRDVESLDWVTMQLKTTTNVEPSFFNDWFTGHLNYQIEHHLFPTMPRTSFHKVRPLVMSLCNKHGLRYYNKSLYNAFADIVRMLEKSGKLWYDAYYE